MTFKILPMVYVPFILEDKDKIELKDMDLAQQVKSYTCGLHFQ
jgi:hypothetical protein